MSNIKIQSTRGMLRTMVKVKNERSGPAPYYNPRKCLTIDETAAAMKISPGTLRTLMARHRPAPQGLMGGGTKVASYDRNEMREWWRSLPQEVRDRAQGKA